MTLPTTVSGIPLITYEIQRDERVEELAHMVEAGTVMFSQIDMAYMLKQYKKVVRLYDLATIAHAVDSRIAQPASPNVAGSAGVVVGASADTASDPEVNRASGVNPSIPILPAATVAKTSSLKTQSDCAPDARSLDCS